MDEVKEELDRVFGSEEMDDGKPKVLPPMGRAQSSNVVMPNHYVRYPIEPIRFIGENKLDFFQGNIVKYILRYPYKNGLEDVQKVKRYARMLELKLMGYSDWNGRDPDDLKIKAIFEEITEVVCDAFDRALSGTMIRGRSGTIEDIPAKIRAAIAEVSEKHNVTA